jgi:hypothetical protein
MLSDIGLFKELKDLGLYQNTTKVNFIIRQLFYQKWRL